ncbi:MAG: trypsin-like peptidase domain-containing protein [Planctomycetota bacterium]
MVKPLITLIKEWITLIIGRTRKYFVIGWLALILISGNVANAAENDLLEAKESQAQISGVIEQVLPAYVFIGGGSGVIISEDGYVLTNYHVVGSSKKWHIYDVNGNIYTARRLGYDSYGDVALLKIESTEKLPYLEIGDSDSLKTGQPVIAIGNPFGQGTSDLIPTVNFGIISALHRFHGPYSDAIQTDAPINPGNSGGPLVTLDGKLIGLNGSIDFRFEFIKVNTGIGYAIPVNQIKKFLPYLKSGGQVDHGYIEGLIIPFPGYYQASAGAKVTTVKSGSQAAGLKIRAGDEIIKIDEYDLTTANRFHSILGTYPAGAEVQFTIRRQDKIFKIKTTLEARPAPVSLVRGGSDTPFLGAAFIETEKSQGQGVEIAEVMPGSPAAESDLRTGDIMTGFDNKKIQSVARLLDLIKTKKPGNTVMIKIKRGLAEFEVPVTLGSKL